MSPVYTQLIQHVDPFIGTANGGNTFPGAVRPWGMVSVSPHTSLTTPSGYLYSEKRFYGLGHVHLSGTGCSDLGSIVLTASHGELGIRPERDNLYIGGEVASPGYYSVHLYEKGSPTLILGGFESAVTARSAITAISPLGKGKKNIYINVGRSLGLVGGGSVTIRSSTEAEGYNIAGGFCGEANRQNVYFVARFNQPAISHGIWVGEKVLHDSTATEKDTSIGCWFQFGMDRHPLDTILIKIGISYVSVENARTNLDQEIPDWDFMRVRREAEASWEKELSRIKIEDDSQENLTKFYTALYHMLLHPNIISDVNGEYPLMGRSGIGRYAEGRNRYSIFSLWDTYRTLHPFLTLVYPERQEEIVKTMLAMYTESEWLPKWELAGNETHMMVGDPASIVIADSYVKGIRGFDTSLALEAILKAAKRESEEADHIRPGYRDMLKLGYIPVDQDTTQQWWVWGPASTTLEYSLADWSIAQMAKSMGQKDIANEYLRRSLLYKNLFDTTTMFIRPKRSDGSWLSPFDPLVTEGSGNWSGSGGPGYVEGNAWNYTWFVPHDIQGLMDLFGSKRKFASKLQESFDNRQFTINNEPDIAYPYLFTYVPGEEFRTSKLVRSLMNNEFKTGPAGLPGNDDCGAISGWFVFSALGFYPACPASNEYRIGVPLFRKATIQLHPDYSRTEKFTIEINGDQKGTTTTSIKLNDRVLPSFSLSHEEIVNGGKLVFNITR